MKAVALFSGGLDSILAVKLVKQQGIDVVGINFYSPFFASKNAEKSAKANKVNLKIIDISKEYLKVVKKPRHGYGGAINPCVDCKIFMLKKARQYAKKIGAKFIITGEVLDERPMSQHMGALRTIEKESGLKGLLLRPLSAEHLAETEAEKKGWVDRKKLMGIRGRSRKPQIELAKKFKVKEYPTPAGGCLLCEIEFAKKLLDLFKHKKRISENDAEILKSGRHFRIDEGKIIVGRNETENNALEKLRKKTDYVFEVKDIGSPVTILRGKKTKKSIRIAAELTARYSDAPDGEVKVSYGRKSIAVRKTKDLYTKLTKFML